MRAWFDLMRNTITKYWILEEDTHNFDDTGFLTGTIATATAVSGFEQAGIAIAVQPGIREWARAIESIDSAGDGSPFVITLMEKCISLRGIAVIHNTIG